MSDTDNTMGYTKLTLDEINRRLNEADDLATGDCPDLEGCVRQLLDDHKVMTDALELLSDYNNFPSWEEMETLAQKALTEVTK